MNTGNRWAGKIQFKDIVINEEEVNAFYKQLLGSEEIDSGLFNIEETDLEKNYPLIILDLLISKTSFITFRFYG